MQVKNCYGYRVTLLHEEEAGDDEEEDEESLFTENTFSTLMSFKVRLRLKLKVKTEISLYMAIMLDHPWQSLHTQYYRTV